MGTKYTPGPWEIEQTPAEVEKRTFGIKSTGKDRYVATFQIHFGEPVEANANLIKVAPEMYVKLEKLAGWLEGNAKILENAAKSHDRFQSLASEELANAKNYRATAKDIRKLLLKADGEEKSQ